MSTRFAVVVGSGPNGLAAALTMAQAGCAVEVVECAPEPGGGLCTSEATLPGFRHDRCATVFPFHRSRFFRETPLEVLGIRWIHPDHPAAHPLPDGTAVVLHRSLEETAAGLGPDEKAYLALMRPLVEHWEALQDDALAAPHIPRHPLVLAHLGLRAWRSLESLVKSRFVGERARVLWAGVATHGATPLDFACSSALPLMLTAAAHAVGWPFCAGGAGELARALTRQLRTWGGELSTGVTAGPEELSRARVALLDTSPAQLAKLAREQLPERYRKRLLSFRRGPGVFKVDWALTGPVPWSAPECRRAGTVHIGASLAEIAASERAVWAGQVSERPALILTQPSLFDPTRAPQDHHVLWGYCHVPNGSDVDMLDRIEAQIERYAPGFRARVLARRTLAPRHLEATNPSLQGGDILGGANDLFQLVARPTLTWYRTPHSGLYLCSASTPPGGGVHGMCGWHAARLALTRFGHGRGS